VHRGEQAWGGRGLRQLLARCPGGQGVVLFSRARQAPLGEEALCLDALAAAAASETEFIPAVQRWLARTAAAAASPPWDTPFSAPPASSNSGSGSASRRRLTWLREYLLSGDWWHVLLPPLALGLLRCADRRRR